MKAGEAHYDFVEVMACKRGCIAGGGQPVPIGPRTKKARLEGIYKIDSMAQIKLSSENPIITEVYAGILKGKEHKLKYLRLRIKRLKIISLSGCGNRKNRLYSLRVWTIFLCRRK